MRPQGRALGLRLGPSGATRKESQREGCGWPGWGEELWSECSRRSEAGPLGPLALKRIAVVRPCAEGRG